MTTTEETSTISGNKQEAGNYEKYVGFYQAKVLKVNPNKDELNELLGTDKIEEEIVYTGEKEDDGNTINTAKIDVWTEDVKTGKKFPLRFYIMDKEVSSERTGKVEWINSVGASTWAAEESDLPNYFTNFTKKDSEESMGTKSVRKALVGEDKLYKFLRSWIALDYFHPDTKLVIGKEKLMKGDMSDLNKLITTDIAGTVILEATVHVAEKDGEMKEYQNIYNNAFLPGSYLKWLRGTNLESATKPKMVDNFIKDITDAEYGCKDFYFLGDLKVYDKTDNMAVGNSVLTEEAGDY